MEAASVAWHPLGWTPVGFSEIEPFPCAILKHRFPNVPNYGSLTEYQQWPLEPGAIDLLVGGCPCQSFSVAGLRRGMEDPRGNLTLVFLGLADKLKPRWIVFENVPGLLSSNGGKDFGSFLGALVELGYGFAYRVLDAQHFGVPQRRRRVFVVACLGNWRAAAEVLLESDCVRRDPKKGRAKGQSVAAGVEGGVGASGPVGIDFRHERFEKDGTVGTIQSKSTGGYSLNYAPGVAIPFRKSKRACSVTDNETLVLADSSNTLNNFDLGDTRTTHAVINNVAPTVTSSGPPYSRTGNERVEAEALAVTFQPGNLRRDAGADPSTTTTTTLKASAGDQMPHIAYPVVPLDGMNLLSRLGPCGDEHSIQNFTPGDPSFTLKKGGNQHGVLTPMAVRRLTPVECERLQGFPDNWSRISWKGKPEEDCPDGPRYKACGNSMAVPCMFWIGNRIAEYEAKA